jgi:multiple sugar transport system substrate-binding protein
VSTKRCRTARVVAVVLCALLWVSGCGAPAEPPATELVWATGSISTAMTRDVIDMWDAAHPAGPRVRVEALPAAADDQRQLLALELNAEIPDFDVIDLDVVWTAEFASRGWLTDLSALRPDIEASALAAPVQSATWDGRLWAAPFTTDAGLLYYRSDLVDRPPTTWGELVELGTRIGAERQMSPYVVDGAPAEGLVVTFLEYLWGAGGDLAVDGSEVRFDEPAATTAVEFIRSGYRTGFFAPGTEEMQLEDARAAFQSGRAVFMRSWPYAYGLMNGDDPKSQVAGRVGIAPLPTFDGSGTVAALGGHNLAVSRFSRAPGAAREFVRFVATDRAVQRRLAEWSLAPAAAAVYDDLPSDPVLATLRRVLPHARTRPVTPVWAEISEAAQEQIVAGTLGRSTPAEAVASLHRLVVATAGAP